MELSEEAKTFAAATLVHVNDEDFPNFAAPIILEMMKKGHTNLAIAEALVDGMADGLKEIEPLPEGQREPMIKHACWGIVAKCRRAYVLAQEQGVETVDA